MVLLCDPSNILHHLQGFSTRSLHLKFMISKNQSFLASFIPPHQSRRIAPSPGRRAVLRKRHETSGEQLEILQPLETRWRKKGLNAGVQLHMSPVFTSRILSGCQTTARTGQDIKRKKEKKKKGDLHPEGDFPSIPCAVRRVEHVSHDGVANGGNHNGSM